MHSVPMCLINCRKTHNEFGSASKFQYNLHRSKKLPEFEVINEEVETLFRIFLTPWSKSTIFIISTFAINMAPRHILLSKLYFAHRILKKIYYVGSTKIGCASLNNDSVLL